MARNKLDLDHGFMQSIIKNQVDRDNYDREVKAKLQKEKPKSHSVNGAKPKKPNLMPYVPPVSRDGRATTENSGRVQLFKFEFENQDGDVHGIPIYKDDDPVIVSRRIGADCGLPGDMTRSLATFLRDKMRKVQEDLNSK